MRVYVQKSFDGECANPSFFIALDGFRQMGWEICPFRSAETLEDNTPEDLIVGYVDDFRAVLSQLSLPVPAEVNYPAELQSFMGRNIWPSTINTIANAPNQWNVFVKPMHSSKKFTGRLVRGMNDLIGCGDQQEDTQVWCSEPVNFVSEWRCFVRYGQILDVRPYRGDWRQHFDYRIIEQAVKAYENAPKGCALDFGLTDKGQTLLVEVNDGYSLGAYGLISVMYAKLLSARWAELTKTEDYCHF